MSRLDIKLGLIPEIRYGRNMEPIRIMRPSLEGKVFGPIHSGKILIIREGGIGDLIMLSPSLRALKKKNPGVEITLASKFPVILKEMPYLAASILIDEAKKENFDSVIDLRFMVESPKVGGILPEQLYKSMNRSEIFGRLLGIEIKDFKHDVYLDSSRIQKLKEMIGWVEGVKYIGLQATCTSNLRTIPPDYLPDLIEELSAIEMTKIILFGKLEYWHGRNPKVDLHELVGENVINLIGDMEIEDLVILVSLMDLVIAPDSSAVHIAGALNIPCLALFGNIDPELRIKYYRSVTALYPRGELECLPCFDYSNPCFFYKEIPTREQPVGAECMRRLTPTRIFEKAKEILGA